MDEEPGRTLIAGATGYVGGRLARRLAEEGEPPRCMAREPEKAAELSQLGCEIVKADVLEPDSLDSALDGITTAYYLVHSMGRGADGDFAERDREAAVNFARAAKRAGTEQILYLGGLGRVGSKHLSSRHQTALALGSTQVPVTYLRAGERITLGDLLHLTLVASDNGAARALARASDGGSVAFIERMNAMAARLGLTNTHYVDPSGLDARNVSTAYDISHLMGSETVASMVVMEGGVPAKDHYRRFVIRDLDPGVPDDFKAMNEVLRRRMAQWTRQQEKPLHEPGRDASFAALPDLIVIDGGKGQLSAGVEALEGFVERGVAVVSLAKRIEEVFVPGRSAPFVLGHDTPGLQLLQRARDEAHRFAITHHRGRRDKKLTGSVLDDLPGVGPARKKQLIQHFGSPDAVLSATREQLEATPGLPGKVARELFAHLHRSVG